MAMDTDRIDQAAATLTPLEREVLVLSAGQDLEVDQIAILLGLGKRRVERLLARAILKFDRALDEPT